MLCDLLVDTKYADDPGFRDNLGQGIPYPPIRLLLDYNAESMTSTNLVPRSPAESAPIDQVAT